MTSDPTSSVDRQPEGRRFHGAVLPRGHPLINLLAKTPYVVRQTVLGAAYVLVPRRLSGLLPLARVTLRDLPRIGEPLVPNVAQALDDPTACAGSPDASACPNCSKAMPAACS